MLWTKLPSRKSSKIRSSFPKASLDGKAISPIKSYVDSATLDNSMHGLDFTSNSNGMDWNCCSNVSEIQNLIELRYESEALVFKECLQFLF